MSYVFVFISHTYQGDQQHPKYTAVDHIILLLNTLLYMFRIINRIIKNWDSPVV
jgi:hypothetical protein